VVPVVVVGRFDHLCEATARDAAAVAGCVCGCLLWCRQLARVTGHQDFSLFTFAPKCHQSCNGHSSSFLLLFVCVAAVAQGGYVLPPTVGQPATCCVGNSSPSFFPSVLLDCCLCCSRTRGLRASTHSRAACNPLRRQHIRTPRQQAANLPTMSIWLSCAPNVLWAAIRSNGGLPGAAWAVLGAECSEGVSSGERRTRIKIQGIAFMVYLRAMAILPYS
jgi:hypothetical protein